MENVGGDSSPTLHIQAGFISTPSAQGGPGSVSSSLLRIRMPLCSRFGLPVALPSCHVSHSLHRPLRGTS